MTELCLAAHSIEDRTIVEVWEDGHLIATIYPKDRGIKIVSKYLNDKRSGVVALDLSAPPALHVNIWDGKPIL